jgi:hypothetical protein
MLRKVGVDLPRAGGVRIGQRVARNRLAAKAHVVQPLGLRTQVDLDVAQGLAVGQLGEGHGEELVQAREVLDLVFAPVLRPHNGETCSAADRAMSCENTSLPWCMAVLRGNPQKTPSLTFDVQIETRLKHQIGKQIINLRRPDVRTLGHY